MKKIITSVIAMSLLAVSSYGYSAEERIADMQKMEAAMAQIQKGILYNHKKMALNGVEKLKEASASVEIAPKGEMDYKSAYAKNQAKQIIHFSDKIKTNMEENRKHAASTNYAKVLNECVSCHNKIRKWKEK